MPDVVQREPPQQGVEATARQQDSTDRRVPVTGDPDGGAAGLVEGQEDRQHAGDEQEEQAHQDEVMRRVGERSLVAAVTDVQADIPEEAEQCADDRAGEQEDRQRRPRGVG